MRHGYAFEVNLLGKAATWLLYASLGFVMVTARAPTGRCGSSGPALPGGRALVVYPLKAGEEVKR